ncbi:MAG TPA: STAS domain-containing protein [Bryobacteraceae bacterium]|nr:STAS domain-containing protein [Bryobacteraceae bacterium]
MPATAKLLNDTLRNDDGDLLNEWIALQTKTSGRRMSAADEKHLATNCREFLASLREAAQNDGDDISKSEWSGIRDFLAQFSASRARAGSPPIETAMFIFSLKEAVFSRMRRNSSDAQELADAIWKATLLLDRLGLLTMEAFQKTREEVIARQQQELLELSTPVVRLWDNVLALPLIGTLDSARTQVVMQNLLEAIVQTRSDIAVIDITGVPTVDTLVAQHLLKTVAAARLMGADCIISGIRPQIAQTIIHLGVNLEDVTTKATLADAFAVALKRTGYAVTRVKNSNGNAS